VQSDRAASCSDRRCMTADSDTAMANGGGEGVPAECRDWWQPAGAKAAN
jgi:hypothetical protein